MFLYIFVGFSLPLVCFYPPLAFYHLLLLFKIHVLVNLIALFFSLFASKILFNVLFTFCFPNMSNATFGEGSKYILYYMGKSKECCRRAAEVGSNEGNRLRRSSQAKDYTWLIHTFYSNSSSYN